LAANSSSARSIRSASAHTRVQPKSRAGKKTKTEGALRGGDGERYQYDLAHVRKVAAGTGYSTAHGGVVEGERMLVGYIHKPRGTGSRMHTHKNEQFNLVVQGTLKGSVNGKRVNAPAGTLIYIPANAPHTLVSTPEEDVIFIAIKDLSQGIIGRAVDGTMAGPEFLEGFGPRKAARSAAKRS
jgi:quercetin dioxygenase-like cupin family protein